MSILECSNCKYFCSIGNLMGNVEPIPVGECKRNAPTPGVRTYLNSSVLARWPLVKPTDYCGEHVGITEGESHEV